MSFLIDNLFVFLVHFVEEYQLDLERKNIQLTLQAVHLNKAIVRIDVQQFRRVLDNMIQNNVKHMNKEEKRITIVAKQEADVAGITVQDNGAGMAVENVEMIFDRFTVWKAPEIVIKVVVV